MVNDIFNIEVQELDSYVKNEFRNYHRDVNDSVKSFMEN